MNQTEVFVSSFVQIGTDVNYDCPSCDNDDGHA